LARGFPPRDARSCRSRHCLVHCIAASQPEKVPLGALKTIQAGKAKLRANKNDTKTAEDAKPRKFVRRRMSVAVMWTPKKELGQEMQDARVPKFGHVRENKPFQAIDV
jgi:hypothetical protein